MALLAAVFLTSSSTLSSSPMNLTMYRVTPRSILDFDNKNSGDAAGDLYFRLGDELYLAQLCAVLPDYDKCTTRQWLKPNDDVVIEAIVEMDGDYGLYQECNPTDNSSAFTCEPIAHAEQQHSQQRAVSVGSEFAVGLWNLSDVTWGPPTWLPQPFQNWKYATNLLLGGYWWSTLTAGECKEGSGHRPGDGSGNCTWRLVERRAVVNASCVDDRVLAAVEARNRTCFAACPRLSPSPSLSLPSPAAAAAAAVVVDARPPAGAWNRTTLCYLDCVYNSILGSTNGTINKARAMKREELIAPWKAAFAVDGSTACGRVKDLLA